MRFILSVVFLCTLFQSASYGEEVDFLDFSVVYDGVYHYKQGNTVYFKDAYDDSFTSSPHTSVTGDWQMSWGGSFISDKKNIGTNFAAVLDAGTLTIRDWGGTGTVTTANAWQATEDGTLDISGVASTIGNGFQGATEGISWFYSINGGDNVEQFLGGFGTGDASHTWSNIQVSAGDQVSYGFAFEVYGWSDGADISSMSLSFSGAGSSGGSGTPEPTSLLMFGSLGLLGLRRRRRPVN